MNELISPELANLTAPAQGLNTISMSWLLAVAAFSTLFSLLLAWLGTFILYAKVEGLKKLFPATHNLIRAHIDYLMMTMLLSVIYFICLHLSIVLPDSIIVILCIGALYNPFGFIVKAINPKAGQSDSFFSKLGVCLGFVPATIGFGYSMVAILMAL